MDRKEFLNVKRIVIKLGTNVLRNEDGDVALPRIYSYIDELPSGSSVEIKVNLYAAYAGTFMLPAISCEAMYDSLIKATTTDEKVVVK